MLAQPDIIAEIRAHHRARRFAMKQQQKMDRALESYIRLNFTDWSPDADEAAKKANATLVAKLIEAARVGQGEPELIGMVTATDAAREPFDKVRKAEQKAIAKLAEKLPVWEEFGKGVRGFGIASLGAIVGEAGDLSLYPTHSHLWKRMGLAVMNGKRQGNAGKSASAEEWTAHGYNPERRSVMWNIGDPLIKGNDGLYRQLYDSRKVYEMVRDPAMSKMQAHRRAQRYMEKRLLKDLWRAWRRAVDGMPEGASPPCLPPQNRTQAMISRDRTNEDTPAAAVEPMDFETAFAKLDREDQRRYQNDLAHYGRAVMCHNDDGSVAYVPPDEWES